MLSMISITGSHNFTRYLQHRSRRIGVSYGEHVWDEDPAAVAADSSGATTGGAGKYHWGCILHRSHISSTGEEDRLVGYGWYRGSTAPAAAIDTTSDEVPHHRAVEMLRSMQVDLRIHLPWQGETKRGGLAEGTARAAGGSGDSSSSCSRRWWWWCCCSSWWGGGGHE